MFTNVQIDFGFILGALVPTIVAAIAPHHLHAVWRICLGLGVIPPLSLIYLRFKLDEPESYARENFRNGKTPYWLALKFYGPRLALVSAIWFIYVSHRDTYLTPFHRTPAFWLYLEGC